MFGPHDESLVVAGNSMQSDLIQTAFRYILVGFETDLWYIRPTRSYCGLRA